MLAQPYSFPLNAVNPTPLTSLTASAAVVWSDPNPAWRHMPPRYRATGSLQIAGEPAIGAVLTFHPLNQILQVNPQAVVQADGQFEVRTPYFGAGAPAGDYAVTITWLALDELDGRRVNRIAPEYADVQRTSLHVTLPPRINQLTQWSL